MQEMASIKLVLRRYKFRLIAGSPEAENAERTDPEFNRTVQNSRKNSNTSKESWLYWKLFISAVLRGEIGEVNR